ncbi:MAG: hypothetical protein V4557_17270 [Bacteroidota bacterium]
MKTEVLSLRRILVTGLYALLIFSILALIRSQNKHLISNESNKIQETSVVSAA